LRINRFIASCGVCSRRDADKLIEENRVKINDNPAQKSDKVDNEDSVLVDGKRINLEESVYLAFNKPAGYLTALEDSRSATIMDLIDVPERVFPLGRLDLNSEGLLILTNDGDMFNRLMHPRSEVWKKYYVTLRDSIDLSQVEKMKKGVFINSLNYKTKPCNIEVISDKELIIQISEGKKRQIRRMLESVGNRVKYLKRLSVGEIELGNLPKGEIRYLTSREISYLKSL
tara:strand:- start:6417 stop:7103 length:687 start_codon:yes stop_codon:yes gene_type:complete